MLARHLFAQTSLNKFKSILVSPISKNPSPFFHSGVLKRTYAMMQADITKRLTETFNPVHLEIVNESYKHNVPKGSETHFKVVIASDKFKGLPLIEQHRMVNEALDSNLKTGVHALAIKTMTAEKWEALCASNPQNPSSFSTPNCLGGSKHDKKQL